MKEFQNTGKMAHHDALGDKIILGKLYGWSKNDNGFTHVITGIAEKITEKGITIKTITSMRGLYEYDPEPFEVKDKINVKGFLLFPIPPTLVKKDYTIRRNNNGFAHLD